MQFIYQLKLTHPEIFINGPSAEEMKILEQHITYLSKLKQQGIVLLSGRTQITDKRCFGIVILEADNINEAEKIMQNDPAVMHDIMSAELFPFKIAI